MENSQAEQQQIVNQIYQYAAKLMFEEGKSASQTKEALMAQGLEVEAAVIVVQKLQEQFVEAKREKGKKDMMYGALWTIGGIVVTVVSYSMASGGGKYMLAWGAVVFGAIQFFRGWASSNSTS